MSSPVTSFPAFHRISGFSRRSARDVTVLVVVLVKNLLPPKYRELFTGLRRHSEENLLTASESAAHTLENKRNYPQLIIILIYTQLEPASSLFSTYRHRIDYYPSLVTNNQTIVEAAGWKGHGRFMCIEFSLKLPTTMRKPAQSLLGRPPCVADWESSGTGWAERISNGHGPRSELPPNLTLRKP
ncbi:hypothetical protein GYMLUDRAFT_261078 [Collybiopsis luxurians FD-317 M1]|uniref:Uncharacterized protein n=1 Tax=Collybiopsis luxurians FD-317 M1 TaxID=944289 RepID=A0A0D0CQ66_9AGAR|nr:hypothetical protein GYMLUDRAFT_261078 [Collybiopsis luxurians FD-317 M1]